MSTRFFKFVGFSECTGIARGNLFNLLLQFSENSSLQTLYNLQSTNCDVDTERIDPGIQLFNI